MKVLLPRRFPLSLSLSLLAHHHRHGQKGLSLLLCFPLTWYVPVRVESSSSASTSFLPPSLPTAPLYCSVDGPGSPRSSASERLLLRLSQCPSSPFSLHYLPVHRTVTTPPNPLLPPPNRSPPPFQVPAAAPTLWRAPILSLPSHLFFSIRASVCGRA